MVCRYACMHMFVSSDKKDKHKYTKISESGNYYDVIAEEQHLESGNDTGYDVPRITTVNATIIDTTKSTQSPSYKATSVGQIEKTESSSTVQPTNSSLLQHPCDLSSSKTSDSVKSLPSDNKELHEPIPATDQLNTLELCNTDLNADREIHEAKLLDDHRRSPLPLPRSKKNKQKGTYVYV